MTFSCSLNALITTNMVYPKGVNPDKWILNKWVPNFQSAVKPNCLAFKLLLEAETSQHQSKYSSILSLCIVLQQ